MTRRFFLVATVASVLAGSAKAADMPPKAPPAPIAPACDRCGVYLGLNAGWVGGEKNIDFTGTGLLPAGLLPNETPSQNAALEQLGSPQLKNNGFIGGGQIGVNSQWNNWVVGLEGDIQYMDLSFTRTTGELTPFGTALGTPSFAFHEQEQDHWLATIRTRIGVTVGPVLLYGTGGFALGQQDFSQRFVVNNPGGFVVAGASEFGCTITGTEILGTSSNCVFAQGSTNRFAMGWTGGGGLEYRFSPDWSVKAEALYVDLGKEGFDETLITPAAQALNCPLG